MPRRRKVFASARVNEIKHAYRKLYDIYEKYVDDVMSDAQEGVYDFEVVEYMRLTLVPIRNLVEGMYDGAKLPRSKEFMRGHVVRDCKKVLAALDNAIYAMDDLQDSVDETIR